MFPGSLCEEGVGFDTLHHMELMPHLWEILYLLLLKKIKNQTVSQGCNFSRDAEAGNQRGDGGFPGLDRNGRTMQTASCQDQ